jgi:quercetin dioxygenase-like cupin family protein
MRQEIMATAQLIHSAFAQESRLAKSIWYIGNLMTIHLDASDTDGAFSLIEAVSRPGSEPPLHTHQNEDEVFYILEGKVTVTCGDERRTLLPGQTAFLPRGIPHTFRIESETARSLVWITPAGFEEYFRVMGRPADKLALPAPAVPDVEKLIQTASRFGIQFAIA